ncbi:MAG: rod shape-determining protein RodA [Hydrogenothermaceae bacterium]
MIKEILSFKDYDRFVLSITVFLLLWSVINIYSASFHEFSNLYIKQIVFVSISLLIILFLPKFMDYRKILEISLFLYIIGVVLLILVKIFGTTILGAKRWINLGFFQLQPSEIMKVIVILTTSHFLSRLELPLSLKGFFKIMFLVGIPFVLIKTQPDLGSAILILLPVLFMVFFAGFKSKYILILNTIVLISLPIVWHFLEDYQKNRIIAFFNPDAYSKEFAYQIIQSIIAVGSGQLTGKGFLEGSQSKYYFLPEQHTDFIFATIGEEWGFVVSAGLVLVYFFLSLKILYTGYRLTDIGGKFICYGIGSLIGSQAFINIAMNIGLFPVVGVPLPFLSYGGTALIVFSTMIAIYQNIYFLDKKNKFKLSHSEVEKY